VLRPMLGSTATLDALSDGIPSHGHGGDAQHLHVHTEWMFRSLGDDDCSANHLVVAILLWMGGVRRRRVEAT